MKKALGPLLLMCVGAALGRMLSVVPAAGAAGGGEGGGVEKCTAKNGDVNADGGVNLSDAVTILGHLFLGNLPQLVPLCATPGPAGLPDTGQTKCYDAAGAELPCDSATCRGQDGSYATGCPSEGRFVDNGDGTVTDNCTGLMWQKDTGNRGNPLHWCDALAYCEVLSLGGHDDWRLPNVRELQSIVDYGRTSPSINPVFGALSSSYWSSTSLAGIPVYAWHVSFQVGIVGFISDLVKDNSHYLVRAVRSGP